MYMYVDVHAYISPIPKLQYKVTIMMTCKLECASPMIFVDLGAFEKHLRNRREWLHSHTQ